ncbi:CRAL-TRIO domain-containing protein [Smittium culicis]|uniref:CRAL-TRIO domain-containing protein n=1 Tax=Smittium culicis TaxID=133412 RepID=A0A1R1X2B3_9FUNG|nr:CRAL-TRIO domain-containing protein [Smittium culicis]
MANQAAKIIDQFEKGELELKGCYKHLNNFERHKLQQLWSKLIDRFDVPVNDLVGANNSLIKIETFSADDKQVSQKDIPKGVIYNGCKFGETVADKVGEPVVPVKYENICENDTLGAYIWQTFREDVPDTLVLRFLRARKWDVDKALDMILAAIKWRFANNIDEIIYYGESANDASLMFKGTSFIHGVDKLKHPIVWAPSAKHFQKDQSFSQVKRYLICIMEAVRQMLHYPHERVCLIMDLTNHSNSNMDWPFTKMFLKLLEAYYPECLAVAIINNGPWFFSGVFKMIKPLIDPTVAQKIQFAKNADGLLKFIDQDQLLKSRGGKNDYEYKYILPDPKENLLMANKELKQEAISKRKEIIKELIQITKEWVAAGQKVASYRTEPPLSGITHAAGASKDSGSSTTIAASESASSNQTKKEEAIRTELELHKKRDECQERLAKASLELDSFTRARNIYHRLGCFGLHRI